MIALRVTLAAEAMMSTIEYTAQGANPYCELMYGPLRPAPFRLAGWRPRPVRSIATVSVALLQCISVIGIWWG